MADVDLDNIIKLDTKTVSAEGRINVGKELAGRKVKYILIPADEDAEEDLNQ